MCQQGLGLRDADHHSGIRDDLHYPVVSRTCGVLLPTWHSLSSHRCLAISHGKSIDTTDIGVCYESGFFLHVNQSPVVREQ
ncbi:hypothetical protein P7K49_003925 [Saguinus oedipus]|uniref:Uncharacterized protein n=1 Tax=Saguinus oedipus TaxID=9490 RepID=A0ABQ9W7I8_SAGOE|nr:hypothetical protein P7K49_003925 [Saguinus oedipus]